jgi:predicted HicB family RNase H-like nuclease
MIGGMSMASRYGVPRSRPYKEPPRLEEGRQHVQLKARVTPEQHRRARLAAARQGVSVAAYIGALIDQAEGLPTLLDGREELALDETA